MKDLPTPHGDKLKALLENDKLPIIDKQRLENAIKRYEKWRFEILNIKGDKNYIVKELVKKLNEYKLYIDLNIIFDSEEDFLYRQKGQLKLDNTIVEEFLPVLVTTYFSEEFNDLQLFFGPTTCFSGIRFESSILPEMPGGGMQIREKDQDFTISRKIFIRASHKSNFENSLTKESNIAYLAAECKTNLDKTMFQEAAATALDVKTAVPLAKYYLLCEWLDMTPINTSTTAIDEIIILRKTKRLSSNIRQEFNSYIKRKEKRDFYENFLISHPFSEDIFIRFLGHILSLIKNYNETEVLNRGYF